MRRKVFCVLMGLLLVFPAVAAWAAEEKDDRPLTKKELAEFQSETPKVEAELKAFVAGRTKRADTKISPTKFQQNFKAKKESSSPTRAIRRAKDAVQSQMEGYMNNLTGQGWIPVDNPAPIINYKYKFGIHKLKFYCRITVNMTIWCIKMPTK
jgi:hypothetical protein